MNSFQTLQAAALGLRLVLLELRAREGVLQLPELAAAAVQARQINGSFRSASSGRQMADRLGLTRSHCRSEK